MSTGWLDHIAVAVLWASEMEAECWGSSWEVVAETELRTSVIVMDWLTSSRGWNFVKD